MHRLGFAAVVAVCLATIAPAQDFFPFAPIGPVDPLVNGISATHFGHDRLFVTTEEGFYAWNTQTDAWDDYTQPGWIGVARTAVVTSPDNDDRRILGGVNAFFKGTLWVSDDRGANQTLTYESTGGRITDVSVGYGYPDHIVLATTWSDVAPGELLRSLDDGDTWTPLAGHGLFNLTGVEALTDEEAYVSGDDRVLRTLDGGDTWIDITGTLPAGQGLYFLYVTEPVVALPEPAKDDPQIYAQHLFTSNDTGLSIANGQDLDWTQIAPISCRAVSERFVQVDTFVYWTETWIVTHDGRLLMAVNHGWDDLHDATPLLGGAVPVDVSAGFWGVNALTQEHGVYRSAGWDYPSSGPVPPLALSLIAAPNPFNPRTTIRFELPQAGDVTVEAFDMRGRRVTRLATGFHAAGPHEIAWDAGTDLASGVYLLRLTTAQGTLNRRVALVR